MECTFTPERLFMYVNKKRRMCLVCVGKGPESEGWSRRVAGGGEARAHACEWGRAVARAEGTNSPRGAICPSCYEFGFVQIEVGEFLHANECCEILAHIAVKSWHLGLYSCEILGL